MHLVVLAGTVSAEPVHEVTGHHRSLHEVTGVGDRYGGPLLGSDRISRHNGWLGASAVLVLARCTVAT